MSDLYEIKEEIKNSADILTLIGEFVRLKRAGKNYVGLCPFHSEKNPSFTVNPEKQIFHCYGCKKGGDIFTFWMEYHNVDFVQAIKDLAERFGIDIRDTGGKGGHSIKSMIYEINGIASEFYHNTLLNHPGSKAGMDYLNKRGFTKEVISEFKLGYALPSWDSLYTYLKKRGVDLEVAFKAGLIIKKANDGYYDRFRGRVIFPIMNIKNQVVGFGARVLDDTLPKYLNTPETPIFHKGRMLYGLNISHKKIRETGRAVVVEGYTDVISLSMNGLRQCVATLGTSLTKAHIRLLRGYAEDVVVVFDSDEAGIKATLRSIGLFINQGIKARVMILPNGEDPDTFVRKNGIQGFIRLIEDSVPMFDFYLEHISRVKNESMDRKIKVIQEFIPVLLKVENEAMLYYLVSGLCNKINLPEKTIMMEVEKFRSNAYVHLKRGDIGDRLKRLDVKDIAGFHMLNLFVNHPYSIDRLSGYELNLVIKDSLAVNVINRVCEFYKREGRVDIGLIMERLDTEAEKEYLREVSISPSIYSDDEVERAIGDFQKRIRERELSRELSMAKESGDIQALNRLLEEKSRFIKKGVSS